MKDCIKLADLANGLTLEMSGVSTDLFGGSVTLSFSVVPTTGKVWAGHDDAFTYKFLSYSRGNAIYDAVRAMSHAEIIAALVAQWVLYAANHANPNVDAQLRSTLFEYIDSAGGIV